MAYRATPVTVTGYSPFYLHGHEMTLPNLANLEAKVTEENSDYKQRLESLNSTLKLAYDSVAKANRASNRNNKRLYDRKAKVRHFKVDDLVYLYNPSVKPGLTKKFSKPWTGPYRITKRLTELNYEILGQNNKKQVVHINKLKSCNPSSWKPRRKRDPVKSRSKNPPARAT
jgi:hypothetical protein